MSISLTRNIFLALLIFTFAGAAWGWWPLLGFIQGLIAFIWIILWIVELFLSES